LQISPCNYFTAAVISNIIDLLKSVENRPVLTIGAIAPGKEGPHGCNTPGQGGKDQEQYIQMLFLPEQRAAVF
jgi:hypothetical protein